MSRPLELSRSYRSYAKLNLFLYVTGRRDDGYHTLCSLMAPITLHDELEFDFSLQEVRVICDHPLVPEDGANLAARAAKLFFEQVRGRIAGAERGEKSEGVGIRIRKRIPVGGGLGGGSSNAACVLNALNLAWNHVLSKEELYHLGLMLGADVPFFIDGVPVVATGIGEQFEPCPDLPHFHAVVCDPHIASSTVEVYKKYDFQLTKIKNYNIKRSLNICSEEQGADIQDYLHNDLFEPACGLYPGIRSVKEEMEQLLTQQVFMTGSGSSLFALFSDHNQAQYACDRLKDAFGNRAAFYLTALR
ncbi:MAG: 4-(cytidine 5'-diphospho)-2-C-methyl-D-erythritol kinase [Desulfobacteraceae bacterium]|nr:MAG: 4-(cytidine 5'-diphospho)-2-C-methyl-D-erythritol kinase [Desulfobacteraceae bacterium]